MSDQLKELHFLATRLQSMAADGHGYFAQNDIARMIRTADAMFAADARIAALEAENERLRKALEQIASYDDVLASAHLWETGSFGGFDEPGSVSIARSALEAKP